MDLSFKDLVDHVSECDEKGFINLDKIARTALLLMPKFLSTQSVLNNISRSLMLIGFNLEVDSEISDDVSNILINVDGELGEELGGFSRLFDSILETHEIGIDPYAVLARLNDEEQSFAKPLVDCSLELTALDDICVAFDINQQKVATLIFLNNLAKLIAKKTKFLFPDVVELICDWLSNEKINIELSDSFKYAELIGMPLKLLNELSLNNHSPQNIVLWFICIRAPKNFPLEQSEIAVLERLLELASLMPVEVFISAGFFYIDQVEPMAKDSTCLSLF
jgi:hypothetical protein